MAKEIKITLQATLRNGTDLDSFSPQTISIDQSARGFIHNTMTVTTSSGLLDIGGVTTSGVCFIQASDLNTNYLTFGMDDSGTQRTLGRLYPGEYCQFRLEPGVSVRCTAHTVDADISYAIWNH